MAKMCDSLHTQKQFLNAIFYSYKISSIHTYNILQYVV